MKNYECIFILSPNLDEEPAENQASEIKGIFESLGAKILYSENWGKRKLAYFVKKQRFGYYYLVQFEGDIEMLRELERQLKLNEDVLKFLIVRLEANKIGKASAFQSEKAREEV